MQHWKDPRPLFPWSAPPAPLAPSGPRIRPNLCARLARSAMRHPLGVILGALFMLAMAIAIAAFGPDPGPDEAPGIGTSAATAKLHEIFPAAETAFVVRLSGSDAVEAGEAADALAESLAAENTIIAQALVPGRGAYYQHYGVYYLDLPAIERRLSDVAKRRPIVERLSAQPDLDGLIGVASNAEGLDPDGMATLFEALANVIAAQERGNVAALDWRDVAGASFLTASRQWAIIVVPQAGAVAAARRLAADNAARLAASQPGLEVTLDATDAPSWPAIALDPRPLAVACFLASLFLSILLYALRGGWRDAALLLVAAGVPAGVAVGAGAMLDLQAAMTASCAIAVLLMALAVAAPFVWAFAHHEQRAASRQSLVMLAAQQGGPMSLAALSMAAAAWLAWWPLGVDALWRQAAIVIVGLLAAAFASLMLTPCLAKLSLRRSADADSEAQPRQQRVKPWRLYGPALSLALLAVSAFGLLSLWARPPARDVNVQAQPIHVMAKDADAAAALAARIAALPMAQPPNWAGALLPRDREAKMQRLRGLRAFLPQAQMKAPPAAVPYLDKLRALQTALQTLSAAQGASERLQAAALELQRRVATLIDSTAYPEETGREFERLAFAGLTRLRSDVEALSTLAAPSLIDLEPGLRALFISPDGQHRLEVRPKPGASVASLLTALRQLTPDVAGRAADQALQAKNLFARLGAAFALGLAASAVICVVYGMTSKELLAFLLAQLALPGLVAALAAIFALPIDLSAAAGFTLASAVTAAGSLFRVTGRHALWANQNMGALAILAGIAAITPFLILAGGALGAFAAAALLASTAALGVHTVLLPQLLAWFEATGDKRRN